MTAFVVCPALFLYLFLCNQQCLFVWKEWAVDGLLEGLKACEALRTQCK